MAKEKITPRAMTIPEFEKYINFLHDMNAANKDKDTGNIETTLAIAKYIAKEIYGIDAETSGMTPGSLFKLAELTIKLNDKSEFDDEKN